MKASKKRKTFVVQRREIGLYIIGSGRFMSCHVIYEELISDGSVKRVRGHTLRPYPPHEYGDETEKQKRIDALTHDSAMGPTMAAAFILQEALMSRCTKMDRELGLPTGNFLDGKGAGGK